MQTLHLINKPPEHHRFATCLATIGPADKLVLIEDAVLAIVLPKTWPGTVFALASDVDARGLQAALPSDIKSLDMAGLVSLTEATSRIISW